MPGGTALLPLFWALTKLDDREGKKEVPSGGVSFETPRFDSHLPKADLLTFWFSHVGPFLVKAPKGDHLLFSGLLGK